MTVIDLTHTITPSIPVFPGSKQPAISAVADYEADHYRESELSFYSHTGTHMDAPAHIIPGGMTLDFADPSAFTGTAAVIDCSDLQSGEIGIDRIESASDMVKAADFLLFYTGHCKKWGSPEYFKPYPYLSAEAARLIASCGKKGVGVDTFSVDPMDPPSLEAHRILLSAGVLIVENLNDLDLVKDTVFDLYALPLKFENADGAPVRALAVMR